MRIALVLLSLVMAACAPGQSAPATDRSEAVDTPETEASVATPAAAPSGAPGLGSIRVAVSGDAFPIETSLQLRARAIDDAVVESAKVALTRYLASLDRYRDNGFNIAELQLTGPFRDAVSAGLKASVTPGIRRSFALASVRVDRHFEKPWGTRALAEITATIVDKAVSGSAPDQYETGRLRLTGERNLFVTDGWDAASGRWFNGSGVPTVEQLREAIVEPLSSFLRGESLIAGEPPAHWRGSEPTPFSMAHAARMASIDRTRVTSRTFGDVRASIERYDTFDGVRTGLALVRLIGVTLSTDAQGRTDRTLLERRVKVLLFGGWSPEVVDEEIAPGVWLSGGDLALQKVDVNRA